MCGRSDVNFRVRRLAAPNDMARVPGRTGKVGWRSFPSGGRRHFRPDPLAEFRPGDGELVGRLQIEPETRAISEIAGKSIAFSGETPRLPFRMSVTRPEGVRGAMASALADRRRASSSSLRISPG